MNVDQRQVTARSSLDQHSVKSEKRAVSTSGAFELDVKKKLVAVVCHLKEMPREAERPVGATAESVGARHEAIGAIGRAVYHP
jgi:hypothetical protein